MSLFIPSRRKFICFFFCFFFRIFTFLYLLIYFVWCWLSFIIFSSLLPDIHTFVWSRNLICAISNFRNASVGLYYHICLYCIDAILQYSLMMVSPPSSYMDWQSQKGEQSLLKLTNVKLSCARTFCRPRDPITNAHPIGPSSPPRSTVYFPLQLHTSKSYPSVFIISSRKSSRYISRNPQQSIFTHRIEVGKSVASDTNKKWVFHQRTVVMVLC